MKKTFVALIAFVLFSSHVMYLKLDSYFLEPDSSAIIQLFNGTFDKSENVIDRDRMLDASMLGNGERIKIDDSQWTEKDSITLLNFQTRAAGTWVAGISTAPRSIEMDAEAFNTYLEHEGIFDMLASRKENNELEGAAVEKYSKHVKTIFQVGDKRTNDWEKALGYPIEFVPLDNPYDLNTGDNIRVKLLFDSQPLANQLVYANYKAPADAHTHEDAEAEHGHSHADEAVEHSHDSKSKEGHSHDNTAEHTHEKKVEDGHSPDEKENKVYDHNHNNEAENTHSHDDKTEHAHSHDDEKSTHSHDDKSEDGHSHNSGAKSTHSHDDKTEHSHSHAATPEKEHSHDSAEVESHQHTSGQQLRTDADGVVTAKLTADGIWYLQTIHLVKTEEEGFTHESNWTTLTFEVVHGHGADTHTHAPEEEGIPSYVYWIGSLFFVGILFFWFNRKK